MVASVLPAPRASPPWGGAEPALLMIRLRLKKAPKRKRRGKKALTELQVFRLGPGVADTPTPPYLQPPSPYRQGKLRWLKAQTPFLSPSCGPSAPLTLSMRHPGLFTALERPWLAWDVWILASGQD